MNNHTEKELQRTKRWARKVLAERGNLLDMAVAEDIERRVTARLLHMKKQRLAEIRGSGRSALDELAFD